MKYCVRCGRLLNNTDEICTGCSMHQPYVPPEQLYGAVPPQNHPAAVQPDNSIRRPRPSQYPRTWQFPKTDCTALVPVFGGAFFPRRKPGVLALIIWSLILVPLFNIIGTPMAIVAAMTALSAQADYTGGSSRKLLRALVLCITATVIDLATVIFLLVRFSIITRGWGY